MRASRHTEIPPGRSPYLLCQTLFGFPMYLETTFAPHAAMKELVECGFELLPLRPGDVDKDFYPPALVRGYTHAAYQGIGQGMVGQPYWHITDATHIPAGPE